MSDTNKRRIDVVLGAGFTSGLETVEVDELRERRVMCSDLERELSYYRRLLHGRMDLLAFEMRRRAGDEQESLMEALPRILAEGGYGIETGLPQRAVKVDVPDLPLSGRRMVDQALDDSFLMRLPSMSDDELRQTQMFLSEIEVEVSQQRSGVHTVLDSLQAELVKRFQEGSTQSGDAVRPE